MSVFARMAEEDVPAASVGSERSFSLSLSQALLTADKPLLEKLLQTNDTKAIEDTVSDLPTPLALSLLEFICSNMFKAPNQLYTREGWINTILRHNSAFFSQNSRGRASLVKLNRHVRKRLSANQALLRLKGKVDTVVYMSSIAFRKRQREATERQNASEPLLTYEE
ncbi:U3 small nucleolar RNA-associated 5 [Babesia ovata]|uniref:U3 small nucleolar RNA-associated 5 n=1 Tax=Babesia ovata TaxID=189622 RepID=A0A2H6KGV3_9APIC|nr:U3 small nucleolar RNA-associated 5 [Babesia ovata]GBE62199.1 U3 small nucleolar RNA-associated 5 [Babesia ovata]